MNKQDFLYHCGVNYDRAIAPINDENNWLKKKVESTIAILKNSKSVMEKIGSITKAIEELERSQYD